ncbi:hypothetical protein T492DRAFT_943473 [Pavlovales sp. CCMP2436]|nr:hypothetical protein T492DRAFT_943473 [Pavlovales sp. CCMP2436]|mmetsp:Transcript_31788/g.74151  ORF Transcript_31788/g.74151 Transcript_31788/m.74151 type:complete len:111 (-) Transcript_31788:309-641(-)
MPALSAMKQTREGKVARRVEEDTVRASYVADAKDYQLTLMRTGWFEQNEKRQTATRHRLDAVQHTEEIKQANLELTLQRRARLKELLTAESLMYEHELNAIGLAFVKDRA